MDQRNPSSSRPEVPSMFGDVGGDVLAAGLQLAHDLNSWLRDASALCDCASLFARRSALAGESILDADRRSTAWQEASRTPDIMSVARWMADHVVALTGSEPRDEDPQPLWRLLASFGAVYGSAGVTLAEERRSA